MHSYAVNLGTFSSSKLTELLSFVCHNYIIYLAAGWRLLVGTGRLDGAKIMCSALHFDILFDSLLRYLL